MFNITNHQGNANQNHNEILPVTYWDGLPLQNYWDGNCSHEIKRHLLLGRKTMTNVDSVLKSRNITLQTKVHIVKAMIFPVVMYGCESGTIKKAEHQRIDAFYLWCWRRLLRVPWTARRSNQSTLKEINPNIHWKDWCWSWITNTLDTWCQEPIHWKRPCCWKRLRARGEWGNKEWDDWMASPTEWTWVWTSSRRQWKRSLVCCSSWGCRELNTT